MKENGKDSCLIVIGSALIAFASKCIFDPCGMVTGGVSGLAILIKRLSEIGLAVSIPLWVTTIVFNIPLMLIAWKKKGLAFIWRVLFATAAFSVWLAVLPEVDVTENDLVLAAIFGALSTGAGVGLVFRARATTGGTETLATLLWERFPYMSVTQILMILDGIVVCFGAIVFGISKTLYAVMTVYMAGQVADKVMEGGKFAKQVFIVTEHGQEIAKAIMDGLDRGVTGLHSMGMYSGAEKIVLYCIVSRKELVTLKAIVHEKDPKAFLTVGDAREVFGEGFIPLQSQNQGKR